MYLFFDTETVGLPKNYRAPVTDLDNWPRMIQIAWALCDADGDIIEAAGSIIKPEGFVIPEQVAKIHRITTERALKEGKPLIEILTRFNELVERSEFIVAHNIGFDKKIIGAEFIRKKIESTFEEKEKICTMLSSTKFCKLPGQYGFKWPKLSELYIKLFGQDFEDAHDAAADIRATVDCFWALRKAGVL